METRPYHVSKVIRKHTKLNHNHPKGPCKIYGLYRAGANGGMGQGLFTHINNGAGTFFIKHIYGANTFLFIFMNYFLH